MRTAKLVSLLRYAEEFGGSRARILRAADVRPDAIEANNIQAAGFTRVLTALFRSMPESFAIDAGLRCHCMDFGLIGYALLTSRNFGSFADRWLRKDVAIGQPLAVRSIISDGEWVLEMVPRFPLPADVARACVEESFASILPVSSALTGTDYRPVKFEVADHFPLRDRQIEQRLGSPVVPSAGAYSRAVLRTADRQLPISLSSNDVQRWSRIYCDMILPDLLGAAHPLEALRGALIGSRGNPPTIDYAAAMLGMSKRTLNRVLAGHGTSYQRLVREYRRDYALALLRNRTLPVKDIAIAVGFEDAANFRRAFQSWTGSTMLNWSRAELGSRPPRW